MGLTSNQEAANGWTDEKIITYDDFSIANIGVIADSTAHTFQYTIPAGSVVCNVGAELVTAFKDSGGGAQLNVIVGDPGDDNGFLTTAALHDSQAEITKVVNTGTLIATATKAYAAASTIDIKFSIAGAAYTVNELNEGRVKFKFTLISV
tara:strand:+ start:1206 stop:1655 length:450 start_codon:yes stop_codon:yes gene_type:complete